MTPTALILGLTSQDAPYLVQELLRRGYHVVGGYRPRPQDQAINWSRLARLGVLDAVERIPLDANDGAALSQALQRHQPIEVYNLVANTDVKLSFTQPELFTQVNGLNVLTMLEAIRQHAPESRFCQPGTAYMFGQTNQCPQTEQTPFNPVTPYGIAKVFAHYTARSYRMNYGLKVSTAILFNHESPLRDPKFVTQKIIHGLAAIYRGEQQELLLGNMLSRRDWGFAADYMRGLVDLMQLRRPEDVLFATGEGHTVQEFVSAAAAAVDLPLVWEGEGINLCAIDSRTGQVRVRVNPEFYRGSDPEQLIGDASKARRLLGWQPSISFEQLVALMMNEALRNAESLAGLAS